VDTDQIRAQVRRNRWLWYFSIFCRFALAAGFTPAGLVKILGERFASRFSVIHPMGTYLGALRHTGYYYTGIDVAQVAAAILLLIPRTVTLGAVLYFPIILNIFILSIAARFDGSFVSSPLMLLANVYIVAWNYDRLKLIFPFKAGTNHILVEKPKKHNNKFPLRFFTGVFAAVGIFMFSMIYGHDVMPRNSLPDCEKQFANTENKAAGLNFCEYIHTKGRDLHECLEEFKRAAP
jgi:hypothetical protein